ncbi:hypothetical protein FRC10_010406, partial [Ceratobasidium sp. 414]
MSGKRRNQGGGAAGGDAPPRGEVPQGDQRQPKLQRLQQALEDAEGELMASQDELEALQRTLEEKDVEIEELRAGHAPVDAGNGGEGAQPAGGADDALPYSIDEAEAVRTAGRRCCMLHMPWMRGDSLFDTDVRNNFATIISELEAIRSEEDDPEAEDIAAAFWETPRFAIPDPADVFKLGMRKMRSEAVSDVAGQRYLVFQLTDEQF